MDVPSATCWRPGCRRRPPPPPPPPPCASSPAPAPVRTLPPPATCSRAFIRAAADDEEVPVPSPTFLLQNMYTEHQGVRGMEAAMLERRRGVHRGKGMVRVFPQEFAALHLCSVLHVYLSAFERPPSLPPAALSSPLALQARLPTLHI